MLKERSQDQCLSFNRVGIVEAVQPASRKIRLLADAPGTVAEKILKQWSWRKKTICKNFVINIYKKFSDIFLVASFVPDLYARDWHVSYLTLIDSERLYICRVSL